MTRSWLKAVLLISVAGSVFASLRAIPVALADELRLFSSADRNQRFNAYLLSNKDAGVQQNRIAAIRIASLGNRTVDAEWIVNCNETFPQVVSPSGTNTSLIADRAPATKDRFKFELWWSVCKGEFQKASRTQQQAIPEVRTAVSSSSNVTPKLAGAGTCRIANILFGNVTIDIVKYEGYETGLVRYAKFDNPAENAGTIRGEITVDRGGFTVRGVDQVNVGAIYPTLAVDGYDDGCSKPSKVTIAKVRRNVWVVLNDNTPVGTIQGRFPMNDFGVK